SGLGHDDHPFRWRGRDLCQVLVTRLLCGRAGLIAAGLISSAGVHRDALARAGRRLGQPQPQHTVLEVGCAGLAVHLAGQGEPVVEPAGPATALLPALALALFGHAVFPADAQVLALQIDGDVVRAHTGHVCLDQIGVLSLLNVYWRGPGVDADAGHIGKRVGENPAHLVEQLIKRDNTGERVPPARAVTSPSHWQCHHGSPSVTSTRWWWRGSGWCMQRSTRRGGGKRRPAHLLELPNSCAAGVWHATARGVAGVTRR